MAKFLHVAMALCLVQTSFSCAPAWAATNKAPSVSMTAPTTGASYSAPAVITLTANAADADGSITKVAFYRGTTLIGASTNTSSPYSFVWSGVAAGTYSLTAKATDNSGATTTSTAVSITVATVAANTLVVTSPANGAVVVGDTVTVNGTYVGDESTTVWADNGDSTRLATLTGNAFSAVLPLQPGANAVKVTLVRRDKTSVTSNLSVTGAKLPAITFHPQSGQPPTEPANLTLNVNAFSPMGSISKVSFSQAGTVLSTATTEPYRYLWNNVLKGTYTITAEATDNLGYTASASTTVSVQGPNAIPMAALTSPVDGARFSAPASILLAASASDTDGSIAQVDFFGNGVLLSTTNVQPFQFNWMNVPSGSYSLVARATDNQGAMTSSAPVAITVAPANALPTVDITSPANGAVYVAPTAINLTSSASDSDGSVTKLEYFDGSTLIGSATVAPYAVTWANAAAGTHSVTARATDNLGATNMSSPRTVNVDGPVVSMTGPAPSSNFVAPAKVTLTASVTPSSSANIAKVEYFEGTRLLGTSTAAPYSLVWDAVDSAAYQVTARVTDSRGLSATSAPLQVNVAVGPFSAAILNPLNASVLVLGQPLTVKIRGTSQTSTIAKIELLDESIVVIDYVTGTQNSSLTYSAPWTPTNSGTRTLTARVTDALGQTVLSQQVIVNVLTPAEMPQLSFATAGNYYVTRGYIDLYADAQPPSGATIQKVEYLNGTTVIATKTAAPYNMTWVAEPGNYMLAARAVDSAGHVTTAQAVAVVVASDPQLAITPGLDGSTVAGTSVAVSGTIKAPPNSAVDINGKLAFISVDGSFIVDDVPLKPGVNTLTVNLRTVDDQATSTSLTVTSSGSSTFEFQALSASGLGAHSTAFRLSALSAVPFTRVELMCNDGGPVSATVTALADLELTTCLYPNVGVHVAAVKVFDGTNLLYAGKRSIHVASVSATAMLAQGAFTGLMARLRDGKVQLGLSSIVSDYQDNFGQMFADIGANLPNAIDQFGQISSMSVNSELGEIVIVRGNSTDRDAYLVNVMLCRDGIWRVVSM
jgi:hypothetical protein